MGGARPLSDTPKAPRPRLLYLFLSLLLISTVVSLLAGNYILFGFKLTGFALLYLTVRLTERGLKESFRYEHAVIARAPKFPYKIAAAFSMGVTLLYLGIFTVHAPWWQSLIVALVGVAGMALYYGLDPMQDKLPVTEGVNTDTLLKTLDEAEKTLAAIEASHRKINDEELASALNKAIKRAHTILATIRKDPGDLRVARRFLVVYLDGIADVTSRYNAIGTHLIEPQMRQRLVALLNDAANRFDRELERLKANDLFDLDVQIDTLKEQLKH
ncbi:5-bromo-4-chloroindolyl phosphate hydrolysis family protein [Hydrogenimonas sp.]